MFIFTLKSELLNSILFKLYSYYWNIKGVKSIDFV